MLFSYCLSHPAENELDKVEIRAIFLPPNVTSFIHQWIKGLLRTLTDLTGNNFQFLIEEMDNGEEIVPTFKTADMKVSRLLSSLCIR